ncbi:MAG: NAD(P)-dependent oxidoreductase [Dehalococcoidia bacterium]|nr:NAD(P)-dependent oxidoreductase [Dehalococcoidia bacterium]
MPDDYGQISIGVVHPGSMGAAVAASIVSTGRRVVWTGEDRSEATHRRAEEAGLEDVHWLNAVVNQSDVIISVCPPHAALEVAQDVRNLGFQGIFVDANAISPDTAREGKSIIESVGGEYVDGGIVGGPPKKPGTTRLYLSGDEAPRVAKLIEGGPLEVIVLDAPAGAASALKMAYAAWTKGTSALLADILAMAQHEDILEALQQEWAGSQPDLERKAAALSGAAAKAWRWVGEMEEIAATFEAAGLPGDFHRGAAEVYRRLEQFKDDPSAPGGAELARFLLPSEGATTRSATAE